MLGTTPSDWATSSKRNANEPACESPIRTISSSASVKVERQISLNPQQFFRFSASSSVAEETTAFCREVLSPRSRVTANPEGMIMDVRVSNANLLFVSVGTLLNGISRSEYESVAGMTEIKVA
jgi:hypothetical protein